jgi:hypothetical protein
MQPLPTQPWEEFYSFSSIQWSIVPKLEFRRNQPCSAASFRNFPILLPPCRTENNVGFP